MSVSALFQLQRCEKGYEVEVKWKRNVNELLKMKLSHILKLCEYKLSIHSLHEP